MAASSISRRNTVEGYCTSNVTSGIQRSWHISPLRVITLQNEIRKMLLEEQEKRRVNKPVSESLNTTPNSSQESVVTATSSTSTVVGARSINKECDHVSTAISNDEVNSSSQPSNRRGPDKESLPVLKPEDRYHRDQVTKQSSYQNAIVYYNHHIRMEHSIMFSDSQPSSSP